GLHREPAIAGVDREGSLAVPINVDIGFAACSAFHDFFRDLFAGEFSDLVANGRTTGQSDGESDGGGGRQGAMSARDIHGKSLSGSTDYVDQFDTGRTDISHVVDDFVVLHEPSLD